PAFNTLAKSLVSSMVKLPVICDTPFGISPWTVGAEYTTPSNTMAMASLLLGSAEADAVIRRHSRAPSLFIYMVTIWLFDFGSKSSLASVITLPANTGPASDPVGLTAYSSSCSGVRGFGFTPHSNFTLVGMICCTAGSARKSFTLAVSRNWEYPTMGPGANIGWLLGPKPVAEREILNKGFCRAYCLSYESYAV